MTQRRGIGMPAGLAGLLLRAAPAWSSHDDSIGARYVGRQGLNAADCREHHEPCRSIQYALSQAESMPVAYVRAYYSPDGGGRWLPAGSFLTPW